ncbi:MAG: NAD(P)/FAD-dependent oxidoreductase [Oscillospiraceae bacterium]|nr:NAD(P)/FAD-dependent oxidoreductase [Oscillospiraceae bacterium]
MSKVGVVVIGGGPAGLSAAIAASYDGASVLLVERDARLGGTLKQCVHNDFGVLRYDERLAGPEYAFRDISTLDQTNTFVLLQTTVTRIVSIGNTFQLTMLNRHGVMNVESKCIVIATGAKERSARQLSIHGARPSGVFTAGSAQYYMNIMGQLPSKYCIILGSDNISMIMARRLSLEGARVLGVYEPKEYPQGALKNVVECLSDFNIPLHFQHTITHVGGTQRLNSVVISRVDKNLNPIRGSENQVKCDTLLISAGFVPEAPLAESLGIPFSNETLGPLCDHNYMTLLDGVYVCGNAMHISDKVDYTSESGEIAGRNAARYMERDRRLVSITTSKDFLYCAPQYINIDMLHNETVLYFKPKEARENAVVKVYADGFEVFSQEYPTLRPPEVQKLAFNITSALNPDSKVDLRMEIG